MDTNLREQLFNLILTKEDKRVFLERDTLFLDLETCQ